MKTFHISVFMLRGTAKCKSLGRKGKAEEMGGRQGEVTDTVQWDGCTKTKWISARTYYSVTMKTFTIVSGCPRQFYFIVRNDPNCTVKLRHILKYSVELHIV